MKTNWKSRLKAALIRAVRTFYFVFKRNSFFLRTERERIEYYSLRRYNYSILEKKRRKTE